MHLLACFGIGDVYGGFAAHLSYSTPAQRMALERVAQLQIFIEHGVALVPAQPLRAGSGGRRAPCRWVRAPRLRLWPPRAAASKSGRRGAPLDDAGDAARVDRVRPTTGEGRGARAILAAGHPDPPKHRPVRNAGGVLPATQRPHRAERGRAVGDGDRDRFAGALALGAGQGEAEAALARLQVLDPNPGELGAAQRAREADQQQRPIAQAPEVVRDRARIWRRRSAVAASFLEGSPPWSAAARWMPAMVSATRASAVGTGQSPSRQFRQRQRLLRGLNASWGRKCPRCERNAAVWFRLGLVRPVLSMA